MVIRNSADRQFATNRFGTFMYHDRHHAGIVYSISLSTNRFGTFMYHDRHHAGIVYSISLSFEPDYLGSFVVSANEVSALPHWWCCT